MKLVDRKGQVDFSNITGIVMAIGVAIVVISVFAILLSSLQTSVPTGSASAVNETHNSVTTNTSFVLDQSTISAFVLDTSSLTVTNATLNNVIDNGNFTFFSNGTVDLITDEFSGVDIDVDYTYTGDRLTAAQNSTFSGLGFFQNITSQIGLLGTILILTLIVALIVGVFAFRSSRGGGGSQI